MKGSLIYTRAFCINTLPVHREYPEPESPGFLENLLNCTVSSSIGIPPFLLVIIIPPVIFYTNLKDMLLRRRMLYCSVNIS